MKRKRKMIYEGRKIKNNGCNEHENCLTCPRACCKYDDEGKEDISKPVRLSKQAAYYRKNRDKINAYRRKKYREEKDGKSNNPMQFVYEG